MIGTNLNGGSTTPISRLGLVAEFLPRFAHDGILTDMSGCSNTLTLLNVELSGDTLIFNGINTSYAQSPARTIPFGAKSISFWAQCDDLNNNPSIIATRSTGTDTGTLIRAANTVFGFMNASGTTASVNVPITASSFDYYCMTWDGTTAANAFKVYKNGLLASQGAMGAEGSLATANLRLGCRPNGQNPWKGKLANLRIYRRVLSADEIVTLSAERIRK